MPLRSLLGRSSSAPLRGYLEADLYEACEGLPAILQTVVEDHASCKRATSVRRGKQVVNFKYMNRTARLTDCTQTHLSCS